MNIVRNSIVPGCHGSSPIFSNYIYGQLSFCLDFPYYLIHLGGPRSGLFIQHKLLWNYHQFAASSMSLSLSPKAKSVILFGTEVYIVLVTIYGQETAPQKPISNYHTHVTHLNTAHQLKQC